MARDDPFPSRFAFRTSHDFHPLIRCLTCLCDTAKFYPQYVLGSAKVMTEGVLICGEMPDLITVETDIFGQSQCLRSPFLHLGPGRGTIISN
jgi:hypothetical protein